jgi:hypothetical protein
MIRLVACIVLACAAPGFAQSFEVSPIVSYVTAGAIERTADGVDDLEVEGGPAFGLRGAFAIGERLSAEGVWTYQSTALLMTSGSTTTEVFEFSLHRLHGNLAYHFTDRLARWRPFVFGGLGAGLFDAVDVAGDTKLAWNIGAGAKWFARPSWGVEARVRYMPTELGEGDEFCDPFSFCQGRMHQFEISVSAVVRCCE